MTPMIQDSDHNLLSSPQKTKKRPKTHSLKALTSILQDWQPSDPLALRRELVNEAIMLLDGENFTCARACIPAIVVDKQYPIELLHYQSGQDFNEFVTRMLWMHQEFNSAIGILLGVPNEDVAADVQEIYDGLFANEEDCVILLI